MLNSVVEPFKLVKISYHFSNFAALLPFDKEIYDSEDD